MRTNPLAVGAMSLLLSVLFSPALLADIDALEGFSRAWRDDPVWYDGLAECATYEATRTIYGKPRPYTARLFINKERLNTDTFTKSADNNGVLVFKVHARDDVPTGNYTYHFSTMSYVGVDDLNSLKLDMGSQEDCGATFKQYVYHAGRLDWRQHSYFPDEGEHSGRLKPEKHLVFQDALPLILRGYPFDSPPQVLALPLLRDQTDTHLTLPDAQKSGPAKVRYGGRETLDLPYGRVDAHHLVLELAPGLEEHYWFAADPGLRHAMVQHIGGYGIKYRLKTLERRAYW